MIKTRNFKSMVTGMAIALALVLSALLVLSACNFADDNELNNIEASGIIYVEGEQTVTLTGSFSAMGDEPASFRSDAGVNDIRLGGALSGKKVSQVTFVSSDELRIVLSGSVTIADAAAEGQITVSGRAIEGGKSAYCIVWIKKPVMSAGESFSYGSATKMNFSSVFTLPYGSFTEYATEGGVTLVDTENGTLSEVELLDDGSLEITVKDFDQSGGQTYPQVRFAANCTTFGVEIIAYVGKIGSYPLY